MYKKYAPFALQEIQASAPTFLGQITIKQGFDNYNNRLLKNNVLKSNCSSGYFSF